jgi:hypothetical protein
MIINRLPSAKFHLASPNSHWRSRSGDLDAHHYWLSHRSAPLEPAPADSSPASILWLRPPRNRSPAFEILEKMAVKKSAAGTRTVNKVEAVRTAKEAARR